jgi:uncharacterized protein YceK
MNKLTYPIALIVTIGLSGCGTTTGERAGTGALGGYLYDQHRKGNID